MLEGDLYELEEGQELKVKREFEKDQEQRRGAADGLVGEWKAYPWNVGAWTLVEELDLSK